MKIRILESAIKDLRLGEIFYNQQEAGVGDYFHQCLFSDIESLSVKAGIHRRMFGFHRLLSRRFPYAIYYRIEDLDFVTIYRVLDCRRNPMKIRKELRDFG